MANRDHFAIQSKTSELKVLVGRVKFSADGDISATRGRGFSWARTGAGLYTITLDERYHELWHHEISVLYGTATSGHATQLISEAVVSTGAVHIAYLANTEGAFAAADPPENAVLSFALWLLNTGGA